MLGRLGFLLVITLSFVFVPMGSAAAPCDRESNITSSCDLATGVCRTVGNATRCWDGDVDFGAVSGAGPARSCEYRGAQVACSTPSGTWSSEVQGWCRVAPVQPPLTASVWSGRTDGTVYDCVAPLIDGSAPDYGVPFQRWLPAAPEQAPPDPEVLARRALASIQLSPVRIETFPEPTSRNPDALMIVGFPVWLWVDQNEAQELSASASERGFTVTISAALDRIVWDLGDGGAVVTCQGTGVPFIGEQLSPEMTPPCGRKEGYEHQGEFTVTATAHWAVSWSGIGQSGVIPLELVSQEMFRVGEYQVVNTNG